MNTLKEKVIIISNLYKSYVYSHLGKKTITNALTGVNLEVTQNEIFALIGLNGSGKTTTIKLLLGLIKPDSGDFSIFNSKSVTNAVKKRIGYLPEIPYFDKKFTPREMLKFWGALSEIPKNTVNNRIQEVLTYTSLDHVIDIRIKGFSRGMLQRLGIAQALLSDTDLLILDEPMGGLDPKGIIDIRQLMYKLKNDGKTIFFTSHIISEVQKVSDSVGFLHHGTIMKTIKPHENLEEEFLNTIEVEK